MAILHTDNELKILHARSALRGVAGRPLQPPRTDGDPGHGQAHPRRAESPVDRRPEGRDVAVGGGGVASQPGVQRAVHHNLHRHRDVSVRFFIEFLWYSGVRADMNVEKEKD